ncbi:hypothetical protein AB0C10_21575 [Microbispora amethystogenes]|uniref:hypothetical protein n=1 Tax=Microbispora amethystogenes TaxID=1427754 RepID=UPI0033F7FA31
MEVPHLHFLVVPNSQIPIGSVVSVQTADADTWFIDGAQIDLRLVKPLLHVARAVQGRGTLREVPREEPWGQMRLVREDISIAEMPDSWTITEAGIYMPVPKKLITAELTREMAALGTEYLRYVDST